MFLALRLLLQRLLLWLGLGLMLLRLKLVLEERSARHVLGPVEMREERLRRWRWRSWWLGSPRGKPGLSGIGVRRSDDVEVDAVHADRVTVGMNAGGKYVCRNVLDVDSWRLSWVVVLLRPAPYYLCVDCVLLNSRKLELLVLLLILVMRLLLMLLLMLFLVMLLLMLFLMVMLLLGLLLLESFLVMLLGVGSLLLVLVLIMRLLLVWLLAMRLLLLMVLLKRLLLLIWISIMRLVVPLVS